VDSKASLGVLPTGTANVYAAEVGIPIWNILKPDALLKAAEVIVNGKIRKIDVGKVRFKNKTSRYFLMWCGVGLDAKITAEKKSSPKGKLRPLLNYASWTITGLKVAYKFSGVDAKISADKLNLTEHILMALISNGKLYGRFFKLAPDAKLDDGMFDLAIMKGHGLKSITKHAINLGLRRHKKDPDFKLLSAKKISISSKDPLPVHVDAETIGTTPIEVENIPKALNVIIPQDAPKDLFEP